MTDRKLPDHIRELPDGSLEVTLARGLDVDGATVETITLREPTVADEIAAQKAKGTKADQELALVANLAELPPAALQGLRSRDYRRVQDALSAFFD